MHPERTIYQHALVIACARGHRWKEMLDSGKYRSVAHLACVIGVNPAYVTRLLKFTLLAPDIIEAILEGKEPSGFSIHQFERAVPERWEEQMEAYGVGQP